MSQQIRLSIAVMSCAGCVSAVENSLTALPLVDEAVVNLGERTATVSGEASAGQLIAAVKQAGYDAAELKRPARSDSNMMAITNMTAAKIKLGEPRILSVRILR